MQFYSPESFQYLWVVVLLFVIAIISKRVWHSRIKRFGHVETIQNKLMPLYRKQETRIRFFFLALVFIFFAFALARPQWGENEQKIERKGVDLIFMLDTSLSMLAEDVKPNRFKKAKREIKSIVRRLEGDRIGMVVFAGSGFLQTPLTLDHSAFFLFLDGVKIGHIPDPGTAIDRAIQMAINSFPEEELKHKAIVMLSDGEHHEGDVERAIEALKETNVRIYTLGVGSLEGEPIPLKDERGRRVGFKKDRSGNVVVTRLNKSLLSKVAKATGGLYLPVTPSEREIELFLKHLETLGKKSFKERTVARKEDHYTLFLFLAFLFLIFEMLVKRKNKESQLPQAAVVLFCLLLNTGFIQTTKGLNDAGNEHYTEKRYESAIDQYRKAQIKKPDDPTIRFNLGTALYQKEQYQETLQHLEKAAENVKETENDKLKAKTYYNLGNTYYRLGKFDEAVESYKESLKVNPDDEDAKFNLEFIQKKKGQFEKKNPDRQNQNNQQQQNQQNQQQNQDQQQQQQQNQDQQQDQQNQQNQQNQDQNQQSQQNQQNQENQQDQQQNQDQQQDQQDQQQNQQNQQQNQDQQQQNQDQQQQDQSQQQDQQDKSEQQNQKNQQDQQQDQQEQQNEQEKQQEQDKGSGQSQEEQEQDKQEENQRGSGDQQEKDQQDEQKDQQEQEQPKGGQGQQQDQKDQESGQDQQDQQQQQQEQQERKEEQERQKEQEQEQQKENQQQNKQGRGGRRPLQGQMTMDNALRILDALKESEREFQDLRKPPVSKNPPYVENDW